MEKKYNKFGYFFIAPFFIVFLIFGLYPILYTFYLSLGSFNGYTEYEYLGIDNYVTVLSDKIFVQALINTCIIWGVNIILQLGLAFLLVMIFTDLKYRVKGLSSFRLIYYLPNLVAATSVSLIFAALLDTNYGALNQWIYGIYVDLYDFALNLGWIDSIKYEELLATYRPIQWLGKPATARLSVSLIQTWMWFGNSFILLMAAAQAVPKEYFEAAVIDGAGRFDILKNITIPTIKPILVYVAITSLIGGLQLFDVPILITDGLGAPSGSLLTVIMYSVNLAFKYNNYGYASAVAYVLFVIILGITLLFRVIDKVKEGKYAKK